MRVRIEKQADGYLVADEHGFASEFGTTLSAAVTAWLKAYTAARNLLAAKTVRDASRDELEKWTASL